MLNPNMSHLHREIQQLIHYTNGLLDGGRNPLQTYQLLIIKSIDQDAAAILLIELLNARVSSALETPTVTDILVALGDIPLHRSTGILQGRQLRLRPFRARWLWIILASALISLVFGSAAIEHTGSLFRLDNLKLLYWVIAITSGLWALFSITRTIFILVRPRQIVLTEHSIILVTSSEINRITYDFVSEIQVSKEERPKDSLQEYISLRLADGTSFEIGRLFLSDSDYECLVDHLIRKMRFFVTFRGWRIPDGFPVAILSA